MAQVFDDDHIILIVIQLELLQCGDGFVTFTGNVVPDPIV